MIKYKSNNQDCLFHRIPFHSQAPKKVYCLVEIPKGSTNKYEYDSKFGTFRLDRVLYEAVFFPSEYGIIPGTWSVKDKDPLDIMVLSSYPTFPGCALSCRPIGVLRMTDSGETDNKIIAVPSHDPRFSEIKNLDDLSAHQKKEIANFWENYSELQPNKKIKIDGWSNREIAWEIIEKSRKNYQKKFKEKSQ
tara:strand:- start:181 stop:753 length:573 start_codon:yes stop_codon:yes gene_type:complete